MKPTMKSSKKSEGKGTWSDEEYAHPGLQASHAASTACFRYK